jgi:hypothetical protein
MKQLRWLTGQIGLSPDNCRKVMVACVQSVAMFGSELWWKGDQAHGTIGRAADLQILVKQGARVTLGIPDNQPRMPLTGVGDQGRFGAAQQPEETIRAPAEQRPGQGAAVCDIGPRLLGQQSYHQKAIPLRAAIIIIGDGGNRYANSAGTTAPRAVHLYG